MWKKSPGQRKGVRQSIQKNRVGRKKTKEGDNDDRTRTGNKKFLGLSQSKYSTLSRKCFNIIVTACEKSRLIGFTRTDNGEFVLLNRKNQIRHYAAVTCLLGMFMQKAWFTLEDMFYNELRVQTFFGLGLFTIYLLALLIGAGVVLRPKETMDVLNSWSHVASSSLERINPDFELQPHNHLNTCLKVIALFFVMQAIGLACLTVDYVGKDLAVSLVPTLERFGVLPTATLPRFAWQIIFTPLEYISYILPIFLLSFSVSILFMGNGALDVYLQELRRFQIHSLQSRLMMERLYVELELFNRIFQVWFRFCCPALLFGASFAVILLLFMFVHYTTLPFILWAYFGYSGLTLLIMLFWQCYDMILVTRASEDILEGLWRQDAASYLKRIERRERLDLMKRAKAMKPVVFLLADSDFSLGVPIGAWDEIINQILFLRSLF